jgi:hypothetical protein
MISPLWFPAANRLRKRIPLTAAIASVSMALSTPAFAQGAACDRACVSGIVDRVLSSMPKHDPDSLPLAATYSATENSHPAALGMMTAWRTLSATGKPALLAIDTSRGAAYFALPAKEGGSQIALWGRIKIADRKITELEIFLSRSRGDHGFSFSAEQMQANYKKLMALPPSRKKTSHADLEKLARASFDGADPYTVPTADGCQFTEVGSLVIDPGLDDVPARPNAQAPLGCIFPPGRPTDKKARTIVVDDETGLVVTAAVIPGVVYPYPFRGHMLSAFIPRDMKPPMVAQDEWIKRQQKAGKTGLLAPLPATGEVMQVLQVFDGKLQGEQINVYLSGPGMQSVWVK